MGRKKGAAASDREIDHRVARHVRQWMRDVYVFDGNEVRKLTEREIQIAAGRPGARRTHKLSKHRNS